MQLALDRPTILWDLDGPTYPWVHHMAHLLGDNGVTDSDPDDLVLMARTRNVEMDWNIPEGMFNWWWEQDIMRGNMYNLMLPVPGAVEAMWKLSDAEWHIHIVTARLNKFRLYDKVVNNTIHWLLRFGIPYRSLSFTDDKDGIKADAIIDDFPDHLHSESHTQRFLFPATWNQAQWDDKDYITLNPDHPFDDLVERLR